MDVLVDVGLEGLEGPGGEISVDAQFVQHVPVGHDLGLLLDAVVPPVTAREVKVIFFEGTP